MKKLAIAAIVFAGCGGSGTHIPQPNPAPTTPYTFDCKGMKDGKLAVFPPKNKSGVDVRLDGMDDIFISEMTRSGCFQMIERDNDKMQVLFAEMDHCAPDSPDKARFNCATFAKAGEQLGATHYVFEDVVMVSPKVAAADLKAKFPMVGNLEANVEYSAVVMAVRAVDVSSGEVSASGTVTALVPSTKAGFDVGAHGAELKASIESHTPMGEAIMKMFGKSVDELHKSWHQTSGKPTGDAAGSGSGAGSGSAAPATK